MLDNADSSIRFDVVESHLLNWMCTIFWFLFQSSVIRSSLFLRCTFSLHRWYIWHVSSVAVLTFNFSYCFWISYTSSPLHGRGYPHKTALILNSHLWWRAGLNIFQCIFYNFRVTLYCTCLENLLTTLFSDVIQYVY